MHPSYKYNYFSGDIIRLLVRVNDEFDRVRCVARVREFAILKFIAILCSEFSFEKFILASSRIK